MEGEFSCQARNIAGLGNKCNIKVSGPVSTLVAEADMSIIIIGGSFVLFLVVMIVLSIVICRRINKLDLLKCSMKSFKLQLSFYCLLAAVDNF